MSGLRIFLAFILSAVLFIAMGVVEEYETFYSALVSSDDGTLNIWAEKADKERYDDQYDINMVLYEFNNLFENAGKNGTIDILNELPATAQIREATINDLRSAFEKNLRRPVGRHTLRMGDVDFTGPDSAEAHTMEDWDYGNSIGPVTRFRIYKVYSVRRINQTWIVVGIKTVTSPGENMQ